MCGKYERRGDQQKIAEAFYAKGSLDEVEAGVWAEWRNPKTQKWEKTFATFTSEPNGIMRELNEIDPGA
jgi:hypothetical protein